MTTDSHSKRDSNNQGSDTGSNLPTASQAHRRTRPGNKSQGNIGGASGSYANDWSGPVSDRTPRAPHINGKD